MKPNSSDQSPSTAASSRDVLGSKSGRARPVGVRDDVGQAVEVTGVEAGTRGNSFEGGCRRSLPSAGHDRRHRLPRRQRAERGVCARASRARVVGSRPRPEQVAAAERIVLPGVGAAARHHRLARGAGPRRRARVAGEHRPACRSSASASGSRCCSTTARRATPTASGGSRARCAGSRPPTACRRSAGTRCGSRASTPSRASSPTRGTSTS